MMNRTKKFVVLGALLITGLHESSFTKASESTKASTDTKTDKQDQKQNDVALNMIKAMQDCINANQQVQGKLKGQSVEQQASLWSKAMEYIKNLRAKHGTTANRPALPVLPTSTNNSAQLSINQNQYKFLFERLLDEYLVHLGQLYEKQAGLLGAYRTSYYISSKNDQNLSITPNEYEQFVQTLEQAARQPDWGKSINLSLVFSQANRAPIQKTLTLNEIIGAIRNVPLPVSYYTRAAQIGAGVVAAGAIGAGAYYAYNAYNSGQPVALPTLEKEVVVATDAAEKIDEVTTVEQQQATTEKPTGLAKIGSDALEAIAGNSTRTVENWQAGGDAELYGAPGLSGNEYLDAVNLMSVGQLAGNLGKAAATKVGTKLAPMVTGTPTFAATGAAETAAATGVVTTQTPGMLAKMKGSMSSATDKMKNYFNPTSNIASGVDQGVTNFAAMGAKAAVTGAKIAVANPSTAIVTPAAPQLLLPGKVASPREIARYNAAQATSQTPIVTSSTGKVIGGSAPVSGLGAAWSNQSLNQANNLANAGKDVITNAAGLYGAGLATTGAIAAGANAMAQQPTPAA